MTRDHEGRMEIECHPTRAPWKLATICHHRDRTPPMQVAFWRCKSQRCVRLEMGSCPWHAMDGACHGRRTSAAKGGEHHIIGLRIGREHTMDEFVCIRWRQPEPAVAGVGSIPAKRKMA